MATASFADYKTPRPWLMLAAFIIVVVGVGGIIGSLSAPGGWYENLAKPPFNPPNWLFAPVWTILYVMIAVAGWRIWMIERTSTPMKIWFAQMILNWAWTPVWFVAQLLWPAFAIIIVILALIIGFILTARSHDKIAAWLFIPYAAWVAFASLLALSIAILN